MTRSSFALILGIVLVASSLSVRVAHGQQLLLHLPLDGSPAVIGGTGEGKFYAADGFREPTPVDGVIGQGLFFDGQAVVATPFNLDHAGYPQVTVTAWIREPVLARGTRAILSTGSTAGLRLADDGGTLSVRAGRSGVRFEEGDIPKDEWVFVAAVVDVQSATVRLRQNDVFHPAVVRDASTSPPRLFDDPDDENAESQPYVFIGANDFRTWGATARPLAIDDVRVYAGILQPEQVAAIRDEALGSYAGNDSGTIDGPTTVADLGSGDGDLSAPSPNAPAGATSGGSLGSSDMLPTGCQSHDDCPDGQYCAIEQICHPDLHAPMVVLDPVAGPTATLSPPPTFDPPASPLGTPRPVGAAQLTAVSGAQSKRTRTLDLTDEFMTRIRWQENNNRPCLIEIGSVASEYQTAVFEGCGSMTLSFGTGDKRGAVSLPNQGMTQDFAGYGVGALQVCSNANSNGRMKGLLIKGDWIGVEGTIHGANLEAQDALANCREWQTMVSCGLSRLATGVVVHVTQASGQNEQIVGLQLICRQIGLEDE